MSIARILTNFLGRIKVGFRRLRAIKKPRNQAQETHIHHATLIISAISAWPFDEEAADDQELDDAISLFREALQYAADYALPPSPSSSVFYSAALIARFNRRGDRDDRDEAILRFREAVDHTTDGPPTPLVSSSLTKFAMVLVKRFEEQGDNHDLEDAIQYSHRAVELAPHGRLNHFSLLTLAGIALRERFLKYGDTPALNRAILLFQETLESPPTGIDPKIHSTTRVYLARSLLERLELEDDRQDLDNSIQNSRRAIAMMPESRSGHVALLSNAALLLRQRACKHGSEQDLEDAIIFLQEALESAPVDPSRRLVVFLQLSSAHVECFIRKNDRQGLGDAALRFLEGLELQHSGIVDDSCTTHEFSPLEKMLEMRDHKGATLDDAIIVLRHCAKLCPGRHPNYPYVLRCLGKALSRRHIFSGDEQDRDDAIGFLETALGLVHDDHPIRAELVCDLVPNLRRGPQDLQTVIRLGEEALESRSHICAPLLTSLSEAQLEHYMLSGEKSAIDRVIFYQNEFWHQMGVSGQFNDPFLMSIVEQLEESLRELRDKPEPPLPQDAKKFDELFLKMREMGRSPISDPMRCVSGGLKFYGEMLCDHFGSILQHNPGASDYNVQTAMGFFRQAVEDQFSSPFQRLQTSIEWVTNAEKYHHDSALEAYGQCLQLLDLHLATTASISSRHKRMKTFQPYQAVNAASCALRQGDCRRAVELLEQGRTLIWTQLARYYTPVHVLLQGDDTSVELGNRFIKLGSHLNITPTLSDNVDTASTEAAARSYRLLNDDWDRVVADIRNLDGFSRFLLPPQFTELQEAACDGPVISLVASFYSCDAIIISKLGSLLYVPLQTTFDDLARLAVRLLVVVRRTRNDSEQDTQLRGVLQQLWDTVVSPVVEVLEQVAEKKSRIWWCPTSMFAYLPLHAAGDYSKRNGRHLSQSYISSYTPSLSALLRARREYKGMTRTKKFAIIGQAQPAGGYLPLESVESEINFVEDIVRENFQTAKVTKLPSSESTREAALCALRDNSWLHFACHGLQELERPYDSCLCMRDGPLSLYDIIQTDLRNHEFTFLSACETAVGEVRTPDELIHLAAGLQFAGVKSVVGTMWEVEDASVHHLVKAFYKNMFADGEMDSTNAARALHKALRSPGVKRMSLAQRIVFIHIGI